MHKSYILSEKNFLMTRDLCLFERLLGMYTVAGAIYAVGDVIAFVDGPKQGILIADTCGHRKDFGDKMKEFLQQIITEGWGSSQNAKTEIIDLRKRLVIAGTGKPDTEIDLPEDSEWWDFVEISYAQFADKKISLFGLYFWICRSDGTIEYPKSVFGCFNHQRRELPDPVLIGLDKGDTLLMASDGLDSNISRTLYHTHGKSHEDGKKMIDDVLYRSSGMDSI